MIEENVRRKIEDLISRSKGIVASSNVTNVTNISVCSGWITETLNVAEIAIPNRNTAYFKQIESIGKGGTGLNATVSSLAAILVALLRDMDNGLIGSLRDKISAEAFSNFLDHAQHYLSSQKKMESGVIAGVIFEDAVRKICTKNNILETDVRLEDLINTLARIDVISALQSKRAKVASHVRTKATHAQWDAFDLAGVADTIQITRNFLEILDR